MSEPTDVLDPTTASAVGGVEPSSGRRRAPSVVWGPGTFVAIVAALPLVYLAIRASGRGVDGLAIVTEAGTLRLLRDTVTLAVAVTAASIVIGVPVAFLTTRTDLPLRRVLGVLTVLPLVIPTYVGAYALIATFAPGGLLEGWLAPYGVSRIPSPYGFGGAFLALTLFTYPYITLTTQAALRGMDPSLEEASRSLGVGRRRTFRLVTVPQLRPAVGAGSLLVILYVLSDFGSVSLLRYSTFTRAIYLQYQSAFDRTPAAILALVLVALTAVVLVAEARLSRTAIGALQRTHGSTTRRLPTIALGRWRWPAALACWALVVAALVLPIGVVGIWFARGLAAGEPLGLTLSAARHSVTAASLGAVAAVLAATPVAIWAVRYRSRIGVLASRLAYTGYALPGIVVALALVFLGARYGGRLYQTLAMLVTAYVVLFLPQAIGALRSSLLQIPTSVEEAARSLGSRPLGVLLRVTIPLSRRGAFAGAALVFLTVMKELPATLLLSPIGFDTLATRIWSTTSEAFFARAALPALTLIALGSVPLAFLVVRRRELAT